MATLQQVRDKANTKLADIWGKLQTRQDAYFAKYGKYFQLLVTGGRDVENGEEYPFTAIPALDEAHVLDIDTSWSELVPFEIEVHEWVGSGSDRGYKGIVTVTHNGTIYRRERDSNSVDTGWYVYDPTTLDKK